MNIGKLIFAIQEKIAAPTTTSLELLMLKKALEKLKVGAVDVLPYYSSLPNATLNTGKLYYVSADELLYWSAGDTWRSIRITSRNYVWSWGDNTSGMLGDGTTVNKSSPVSVVGKFDDWKRVDNGTCHSIGLRSNGTIWTWGANPLGQLGDGTTVGKSSPVSVVGGFTDWCGIASGGIRSVGIRANGTVWSWGSNAYGQFGDGTTVNKSSPVSVVGGFTDWCQIAAHIYHSLALRTNGTAWAWGTNTLGMLGDGTTVNKSSPVSVIGGFSDWSIISAGVSFSAALRSNGTAWSWGPGTTGQLGSGATTNRSSPGSVIGGITDWCEVSAGYLGAIAIRTTGTLWSWGTNTSGKLGDNCNVSKSSPVSVVGGFTDWCSADAGAGSNAAIRLNGTAWTWGSNGSGVLGDGTTIAKSSPVSVVGGFTNWCQVASTKNVNAIVLPKVLAIRSISF